MYHARARYAQTVYEHAVQRTLRGVRSRAAFAGAAAERLSRRSDDREDALSLLKEMGSTPLLTAAQEVELARQIQVCRAAVVRYGAPLEAATDQRVCAGFVGVGAHASCCAS